MTQEEAAARVGKSRSAVANALRLLGLCAEVRRLLEDGQLTGGHARALLPLKADVQKEAAKKIISEGLSVRAAEQLAKKLGVKRKERAYCADALLTESYGRLAAEELGSKLNRSCRIVSGKKKGRVELDYYGLDDLNELLDSLGALRRRKDSAT